MGVFKSFFLNVWCHLVNERKQIRCDRGNEEAFMTMSVNVGVVVGLFVLRDKFRYGC